MSRTVKRLLKVLLSGLLFCTFFAITIVTFTKKLTHTTSSESSSWKKWKIDLHSSQSFVSAQGYANDFQGHMQPIYENSTRSQVVTPVPIHRMHYDLNPPLSKDVVVHTAYFDHRPRDNHANVTVIFLNINKTIMDRGWVVGCGVDDKDASAFSLHWLYENQLMHKWLGEKPFLYENMEMLCYDMPGKNGSKVFVFYKTSKDSSEIKAISQHPLFIPAPRVTPSGEYNFTTLTCTKVQDRKVPFLHEFVQYQKTIGVDHVHISILDYFIKDKGFEDLVVNDTYLWKEYVTGYLTFSVWKEWYADGKKKRGEVSYHSEILRKLDCMYRFLGTYDYAMPLDTDDFFVPRIPGKTKLKDYILQYCYHKPAGSCSFDWIWYYPKCGLVGEIIDGNVTKHLKTKIYNPYEKNFKSVHSMKAIQDASFHNASCSKCLRPGYHVVKVPTSVAYVAHNRIKRFKGQSPCKRKGPIL